MAESAASIAATARGRQRIENKMEKELRHVSRRVNSHLKGVDDQYMMVRPHVWSRYEDRLNGYYLRAQNERRISPAFRVSHEREVYDLLRNVQYYRNSSDDYHNQLYVDHWS